MPAHATLGRSTSRTSGCRLLRPRGLREHLLHGGGDATKIRLYEGPDDLANAEQHHETEHEPGDHAHRGKRRTLLGPHEVQQPSGDDDGDETSHGRLDPVVRALEHADDQLVAGLTQGVELLLQAGHEQDQRDDDHERVPNTVHGNRGALTQVPGLDVRGLQIPPEHEDDPADHRHRTEHVEAGQEVAEDQHREHRRDQPRHLRVGVPNPVLLLRDLRAGRTEDVLQGRLADRHEPHREAGHEVGHPLEREDAHGRELDDELHARLQHAEHGEEEVERADLDDGTRVGPVTHIELDHAHGHEPGERGVQEPRH